MCKLLREKLGCCCMTQTVLRTLETYSITITHIAKPLPKSDSDRAHGPLDRCWYYPPIIRSPADENFPCWNVLLNYSNKWIDIKRCLRSRAIEARKVDELCWCMLGCICMLHPTTVGRNALAGPANYFLFGWVGSLSWTRIVFWRRFVQFKEYLYSYRWKFVE